MKISVIICTYNRAALLAQTLESLTALRVPDGVTWELVVVDNNSSDDTQGVLARFADRLPLVTAFERAQGHSRARNHGVGRAGGDYIVWTDDDVLVAPNWLDAYAAAFARWPGAHFFGGPARPWFADQPPAWLARDHTTTGWPWALIDLGDGERAMTPGEYAFGANMAYPIDVARRLPFDPRVGHVGQVMAGGDETDLQDRIVREGGTRVWVPAAAVRHYVPADRMTVAYLRRRCFSEGFRDFDPAAVAGHRKLMGVPCWLLRAYAGWSLRAALSRPLKPRRWLGEYVKAAMLRGAIASARSAAARG